MLVIALLPMLASAENDGDPDIERLYASPDEPYQYERFEIYVRAEDGDGLDIIKLYEDSSRIDTCDCDGDDECRCTFDVRESDAGYHTYKVKAYDEDGETESESIRVYVLPVEADYYYTYPYPTYSYPAPAITQAYFIPTEPETAMAFEAYLAASSSVGLKSIEVWHGGIRLGIKNCYNSQSCAHSFAVSPKYTQGNYEFIFRAIDRNDHEASVKKIAHIKEQYVPQELPPNVAPTFISTFVEPASPDEGKAFLVSTRFTDDVGLSRIELWQGQKLLDSRSCSGSADCSASFKLSISKAGTYSVSVKAIDSGGAVTAMSKVIEVAEVETEGAGAGTEEAQQESPGGYIVIGDIDSVMFFVSALLFFIVSVAFIWHLIKHH